MEWLKSVYYMWVDYPMKSAATAGIGYGIGCIVRMMMG